MTYLREQYMEIVRSYPVRDRSDSGEPTVMLPDTNVAEMSMKMNGMTSGRLPSHSRDFQGTDGQSSDTVQGEAWLILGNLPECFQYESGTAFL